MILSACQTEANKSNQVVLATPPTDTLKQQAVPKSAKLPTTFNNVPRSKQQPAHIMPQTPLHHPASLSKDTCFLFFTTLLNAARAEPNGSSYDEVRAVVQDLINDRIKPVGFYRQLVLSKSTGTIMCRYFNSTTYIINFLKVQHFSYRTCWFVWLGTLI